MAGFVLGWTAEEDEDVSIGGDEEDEGRARLAVLAELQEEDAGAASEVADADVDGVWRDGPADEEEPRARRGRCGRALLLLDEEEEEEEAEQVENGGEQVGVEAGDEDEGSDDTDETENVCSLCHDGGDLISCDGPCRRAFHPTLASGPEDGECPSLGLTKLELRTLTASEDTKFLCKNCQLNTFQCFMCKQLGSATNREVFRCQQPRCGKFYHLQCLGLREEKPFTCPLHRCHSSKCTLSHLAVSGKLVVCRLCPRAWHDECVPRYISFEDDGDTPQRGWRLVDDESGKLNAAFVFCSEHDYELNRRGMPSYKNLSMVLFPGEKQTTQLQPRFVRAAKEWACVGCFKKEVLSLVLKDNRVFATCRHCETAYWVNPNKDKRGQLAKYGGKFAIVNRPKQNR